MKTGTHLYQQRVDTIRTNHCYVYLLRDKYIRWKVKKGLSNTVVSAKWRKESGAWLMAARE